MILLVVIFVLDDFLPAVFRYCDQSLSELILAFTINKHTSLNFFKGRAGGVGLDELFEHRIVDCILAIQTKVLEKVSHGQSNIDGKDPNDLLLFQLHQQHSEYRASLVNKQKDKILRVKGDDQVINY